MLAEEIEIPLLIGGKEVRTGNTGDGGLPARPPPRARPPTTRPARRRSSRRSRPRPRAWTELVGDGLGGPRRGAAQGGRAARGALARHRQRRHACSASPRPSTRRRSTRPASSSTSSASTPTTCSSIYEQQPGSMRGHWNSVEYRAARGLRLRGHPVQLHLHRRQPAHRAGADGQHRALEAGLVGGLLRLLASCSCSRRRACPPGVINFVPGSRQRASATRSWPARTSPASTSPARPRSSTACGRRSARTSPATAPTPASSARPAARTSSSPTPRPTSEALATALVRGAFEYQGQKCSAASRAYIPKSLWPAVKERAPRPARARSRWARPTDFRNFMGAVIDRGAFDRHHGLHRPRQGLQRGRDPVAAATATTRWATSSSRRWS